jgi:integrase
MQPEPTAVIVLENKTQSGETSVDRWMKYVFSSGIRSKSTEKTYMHFLRRFCNFTGKTPDQLIEERKQHLKSDNETIKRQHEELLGKWRDSMEQDQNKPLARGSVVTAHNVIKSFYLANYVPLIAKSPKSWKTRQSSLIIPSLEQLSQIIQKTESLRDKTMILALAQSGISLEDFQQLIRYGTVKQELESGTEPLHLSMNRAKLGVFNYDTFLGVSTLEYLQQYVKQETFKEEDLLFPVSAREIEYIVKRASIRADMDPWITPHRLRAFFSTNMQMSFHTTAAKHVPLVDFWMGHKQPYGGTYMIPPVDGGPEGGQRKIYKDHEYAVSIKVG